MTSPAVRLGISPGALKAVLIVTSALTLIFGLVLLVGGIANVGLVAGSQGWAGTAEQVGRVVPVAYILFAVGLFCLAYACNAGSGYTAGGCFIALALSAWIFARQASISNVVIFGAALGSIALVAGICTCRAIGKVASSMRARFATIGGKLILLFGIFYFVGILMQVSAIWVSMRASFAWLETLWKGGFALAGAGSLLGGVGGILLFAAFLVACAKPAPTAPRAVAPPEETVIAEPAPPKVRAPPELTPAQTERMVYKYIVDHEGGIDIGECAEELDISEDDVETAIESLKKKGKLEAE